MKALLLAVALAAPQDGEYRQALDRLYRGQLETALRSLEQLRERFPHDPLAPCLQSLALLWKVEQQAGQDLDKELGRLLDRTIELAERRLRADPQDRRALLARGAAHGIRGRYHFLRLHRREAAQAGARMREDLLRLRALEPDNKDALFGLGLYDYYADVLSPLARLLSLLARYPGGDRARGLERIESARTGSLFHDTEVRVQLYEIHAFWERKPDRALAEMRALREQYPEWPLWGLKLAEHLRERLGLYDESAQVARALLRQGQDGHPNYAGMALWQARLALGEALLLDLRLAEARAELLPLTLAAAPIASRAHLLIGRALEREGDRVAAEAHYRRAATSPDREQRRLAQAAAAHRLPEGELRATPHLAAARAARAAGEQTRSVELYRRALAVWPACAEAAVRVAEAELAKGDLRAVRRLLSVAEAPAEPQPPWVRGWAQLLRAHLRDLAGERAAAVREYKKVLESPFAQRELEQRAAEGVRRAFRRPRGTALTTH